MGFRRRDARCPRASFAHIMEASTLDTSSGAPEEESASISRDLLAVSPRGGGLCLPSPSEPVRRLLRSSSLPYFPFRCPSFPSLNRGLRPASPWLSGCWFLAAVLIERSGFRTCPRHLSVWYNQYARVNSATFYVFCLMVLATVNVIYIFY
jgi:hypothetical protein